MKLRKSLLALVLVPTLTFAVDTAYSPPVGGMTISVSAGQTGSVALPLLHDRIGTGAMVGKLTGVGANYIDVSDASWAAGALSTAANPYYLRITSGAATGRVMPVATATSNTTTRVFVNNDGIDLTTASGPVAGDSYELVLADTLSTLFTGILQGGVDANSADNIQVWSGAAWQTYYYNTTRSRWERSGFPTISTNNIALRPDRGLMITRRAATDLKLYVSGRVPDKAPQYFHSRSGNTFLSVGIPVSQTLGQLSLQTRALGWVSGTSINNADSLQVWSGAAWQSYYYDTTNARWQREGFPTLSSNGVNISGRPVMIRRLNSAAASDSLINLPLPYTLN
ncbi:TIGR02597 family protein [Oleiharenicola lentus]|uniref:TIGR02597 family protein n=1 Tax=Oleiharenicola lentus TaxID=2508720 RepID=UPI003F67F6D1